MLPTNFNTGAFGGDGAVWPIAKLVKTSGCNAAAYAKAHMFPPSETLAFFMVLKCFQERFVIGIAIVHPALAVVSWFMPTVFNPVTGILGRVFHVLWVLAFHTAPQFLEPALRDLCRVMVANAGSLTFILVICHEGWSYPETVQRAAAI